MRFLADAGVSPKTLAFLQQLGHDAVHVRTLGLERAPDADVVARARADSRIVLTFDLDFGQILALGILDKPSVIIFRLEDERSESVNRRLSSILDERVAELQSGAFDSGRGHELQDAEVTDSQTLTSLPACRIQLGANPCLDLERHPRLMMTGIVRPANRPVQRDPRDLARDRQRVSDFQQVLQFVAESDDHLVVVPIRSNPDSYVANAAAGAAEGRLSRVALDVTERCASKQRGSVSMTQA